MNRPRYFPLTRRAASMLLAVGCGSSDKPGATDPGTSGAKPPAPVASITVAPTIDSLLPDETATLTATVKDSAGNALTGRTVTWVSTDPTKATVSATGLVTALVAGPTFVRATSESKADSATVVVRPVPVASLRLDPPTDTIGSNDSLQFTATLRDKKGTSLSGRVVSWSTSSLLVTISPTGLLKGKGATGTVSIVGTSEGKADTSFVALMACSAPLFLTVNRWTVTVQAGGAWGIGPLDNAGQLRTTGTTLSANPTEVLYQGGLIFGTSASNVVRARDFSTGSSDLVAGSVCPLTDPNVTSHTYADVRPVAGQGINSLQVRQETFAFGGVAADTGYVLFKYSFVNTGDTTISVQSGFGADWDLRWNNSATDDILRWNAASATLEAAEQDSATYKQIVGVAPAVASSSVFGAGWLSNADPNKAGYFSAISGNVGFTTLGPGDVRGVLAIGPLPLLPGGRIAIYYAVVGGDTRAQFNANVTRAQAKAAAMGF